MIKMKYNLLSATILGGILLSASASHANDPAADAVVLARSIANDAKSTTPALKNDVPKNIHARRQLMDRLQERNQDDVSTLFTSAKSAGVNHLDLYEHFIDLAILETPDTEKAKIQSLLESAALSTNWRRKNLANLFLGSYFIHQRDNLNALTYAQQALEAIPTNTDTQGANDARYETYDLLHTAFAMDRNISKTLEATQKLLEYGHKSARNIDEIPLIHNISYILSKSRDFETAAQVSEILVDLQKGQPNFQRAVAKYSHGTNLSEAKKYDEAIPFLEDAAGHAENTRFAMASNIRLALAYSKVGQTRKSQRLIRELETSKEERAAFNRMHRIIERAKAENAYRSGDFKSAYTYLETWSDVQTNDLEALISEDRRRASEGLAVSERVAREREERLQYEVAANKEIAKRGTMISVFAGLLAIALGFITLNLNRQRKRQIQINAELAVARDRALAGEKTKSKFLSMMGHELRTPMNPIISLADILFTRSNDADIKQMLRMISASGRTMLSMVENILIVADETKRKLKLSTQKTKIRNFIRFTCTGFQRDAESKGLNFIVNIDENVPEQMDIDKLKLKSILNNMLSNAIKFTEKGAVYVSVLMVQDPHLGVSLLLSIKDTGTGMTQQEIDELRAIFEQHDSSHTKTYEGIGVGLYVTELYAKAHGGRMAISSHPQDGTRIDVYIPYDMSPQAQLAA